jgi:hypothetical protein
MPPVMKFLPIESTSPTLLYLHTLRMLSVRLHGKPVREEPNFREVTRLYIITSVSVHDNTPQKKTGRGGWRQEIQRPQESIGPREVDKATRRTKIYMLLVPNAYICSSYVQPCTRSLRAPSYGQRTSMIWAPYASNTLINTLYRFRLLSQLFSGGVS